MTHARSTATALAALAAAALLSGCGGDAAARPAATPAPTEKAPAKPKAKPKPPSRQDLLDVLKQAAISEEMYFLEEFTYTKNVAHLKAEGLAYPSTVKLAVLSADKKRYCIRVTGGKHVVYYDSDRGAPSATACR